MVSHILGAIDFLLTIQFKHEEKFMFSIMSQVFLQETSFKRNLTIPDLSVFPLITITLTVTPTGVDMTSDPFFQHEVKS